jgi:hypothetical protein
MEEQREVRIMLSHMANYQYPCVHSKQKLGQMAKCFAAGIWPALGVPVEAQVGRQ